MSLLGLLRKWLAPETAGAYRDRVGYRPAAPAGRPGVPPPTPPPGPGRPPQAGTGVVTPAPVPAHAAANLEVVATAPLAGQAPPGAATPAGQAGRASEATGPPVEAPRPARGGYPAPGGAGLDKPMADQARREPPQAAPTAGPAPPGGDQAAGPVGQAAEAPKARQRPACGPSCRLALSRARACGCVCGGANHGADRPGRPPDLLDGEGGGR